MAEELYHYGRMGMKWGQHIYAKHQAHKRNRLVKKYKDIATPEQVDNYISVSSRKKIKQNSESLNKRIDEKTGKSRSERIAAISQENARLSSALAKGDRKYAKNLSKGKGPNESMSAYKDAYKVYDSKSNADARAIVKNGRETVDSLLGGIGKTTNATGYNKKTAAARATVESMVLGRAGSFVLEDVNKGRTGAKLNLN